MRQTLHIFKKDIRHLRFDIILFLALTTFYALAELHWGNRLQARWLLLVSAVFLIPRLFHAELIPGDNQFWISRPYRWQNLLAEKFLFLLVFINLPIFAARLIILLSANFPLSAVLLGLLWSQVLLTFVVFLPIAALAILTTGMVPFVFATLVMLAVALGMEQMMVPPSVPAVRTLIDGVQWQWNAFAALALSAAAITIVCSQYPWLRFSKAEIHAFGVVPNVRRNSCTKELD